MFKYILKRIIIFIPTLIAISLLTFAISVSAPGDPVEQMLNQTSGEGRLSDKVASEKAYNEIRAQLGLNLPVFYFSLDTKAMPDSLHRIPKLYEREMLSAMTRKYGNWAQIEAYHHALKNLETATYGTEKNASNATDLIKVKADAKFMLINYKHLDVSKKMNRADLLIHNNTGLAHLIDKIELVKERYQTIIATATPYKNFIPVINFNSKNQYHRWLFGDGNWITGKGHKHTTGILRGDFGISYQTKQKISLEISDRLKWTMIISFVSILLTYLISLPVGVYSAVHKGSFSDNAATVILFVLYSLPVFWIATLLAMYFGGGDYLDWFPVYGIGEIEEDAGFFDVFLTRSYHLILPIFCSTYGSFAFLSRQMRGGMLSIISQDYIRTAYAKGLDSKKVIWKHAFRNSLLPIITLFANVFPIMIGGSVVLEVIFTIPGMGRWGYNAIMAHDYPVIFTVMMLSAILTMIGYLVADILYAVADPRISFSDK